MNFDISPNSQHNGHESKYSKLKKLYKYNQSGQLRYVVKYKVRKMAKSLLKYHNVVIVQCG